MVKLLNDYRSVIGWYGEQWFVKTRASSGIFINCKTDDKFKKSLVNYKPFRCNNNISLTQIVSKFSKYFKYESTEMVKDSKPNIINKFAGFKYQEVITDDFTILQPMLNYIKEVICNNSQEKYDYFMCWFANIIQNITVKNCTMMILHGAQGSGKSIVLELFCELLGKYALANVDDLDKVFGKFDSLLSNHLLMNINEPPEADDRFRFNGLHSDQVQAYSEKDGTRD